MKTLVIVASGLHLGYVGCYGNEWVHTPTLDRLAAEGIVFDQHYADQPDDAGALRAWQTGCFRLLSTRPEDELPIEPAPNVFALLAEHSLATCLVSDNPGRLASSETAGWQHIHIHEAAASPEQTRNALAKALIHLPAQEPWLLRFDLRALLPPWSIPDDFRSRYSTAGPTEDEDEPQPTSGDAVADDLEDQDVAFLELQNSYAAAVSYLDTALDHILGELEERGLLEDLLLVVTSDRGQRLGEEMVRPGLRLSLHEELIHIPLILRLPGKAEAGRRVNLLTQAVDLLPTLFDVFGVAPPFVHGQSLVPLAKGGSKAIRTYACAGLRAGDRIEWGLRSPEWFFLQSVAGSAGLAGESELYVKPDDRWEVNNVRQHHLEFAERLEKALACFAEATGRPGPLQPPELPSLELEPPEEQQVDNANSAERSTAS